MSLIERRIASVPWETLRTGHSSGQELREHLTTLLLCDSDEAGQAYRWLEGVTVCQGDLFDCAPAVVATMMAALADDCVPEGNLGCVLELLVFILMGYSADSEIAIGNTDLRQRCHREAMKGYWLLVRLTQKQPDPYGAASLAKCAVEVLEEEHGATATADVRVEDDLQIEHMAYPTPNNLGRLPNWENLIIATTAEASLGHIPRHAVALGVEISGLDVTLRCQLSAITQADENDLREIVEELEMMLNSDVRVSYGLNVVDRPVITPFDKVAWFYVEHLPPDEADDVAGAGEA